MFKLSDLEIKHGAMKYLAGKPLWHLEKEEMSRISEMAYKIRIRKLRRGQEKFKITVCNHDFKPSEWGCSYCYPEIASHNYVNKGGRVTRKRTHLIWKFLKELEEIYEA